MKNLDFNVVCTVNEDDLIRSITDNDYKNQVEFIRKIDLYNADMDFTEMLIISMLNSVLPDIAKEEYKQEIKAFIKRFKEIADES